MPCLTACLSYNSSRQNARDNLCRLQLFSCTPEPHSDEDAAFAEALAAGVEARADELDAVIAAHAIDWSIGRIARVDLSILRIAVYEMLYRDDVPCGAAINEAVELAKRFGGEKSSAFVNGILGAVARERCAAPVG